MEAVIRARLTAGENHRYAALIAGMAIGCLPCNGRNAVATAAIAANEQRKIGHRNERNQPDEHDSQGKPLALSHPSSSILSFDTIGTRKHVALPGDVPSTRPAIEMMRAVRSNLPNIALRCRFITTHDLVHN